MTEDIIINLKFNESFERDNQIFILNMSGKKLSGYGQKS